MKRALVTGGGGAIGAAICRRLATDGHHVIVHGHARPEAVAAVVDAIRAEGGTADAVIFDVANPDLARAALEKVLARGPVQIVVNNAGVHADAPLAGMSPEQWQSVMDVTLNGFFNVTQPLLLPMIRTRWGRIVSISSVAAVLGNRGQANYAAAKAGLHGATKSLAREVASRGITANVVAPGIIATPMTEAVFDQAQIDRLVPMQRAGLAAEVAALVAFLVSDDAGYVSGQVIAIDGAMT